MGTDVHSIGQVYINGKWETKLARVAKDDRNYDSFAVLAGVRNGYGFAGCPTGEGWKPISNPRGLPLDVLDQLDEDYSVPSPVWYWSFDEDKNKPENSVWLGDHSFSWLLLSEIDNELNRLGNLEYLLNGIVDKEQFILIQEGKLKSPKNWSGGVGGKGVKVISKEEALSTTDYTHVEMEWKVPAINRLFYLKNVREELIKLANEYHLEYYKVRIVFGFDS